VTKSIDEKKGEAPRILFEAPGITALDFAFERDADRAMSNALGGAEPGHDDRAFAGRRMNVELARETANCTEARAGRPGRGITVFHTTIHVDHSRPAIDGQQLDDSGVVLVRGEVSAELAMPCQRCLDRIPIHVQTELKLAVVADETQLVPDLYEPFIATDGVGRLADLVEEEIAE